MSCQFDGAATTWLDFTAAAPNYNAAFTISLWFRPQSTSLYEMMCGIYADINDEDGMSQDGATPNHFQCEQDVAGTIAAAVGATTYSNNTWHFIAVRRYSATKIDVYLDTAVDGTNAAAPTVAGRTASTAVVLGAYPDHTGQIVGRMAQVRIWTAQLTDAELATEKASATAVRTTSLWAEWRLASAGEATTDSSGNARTLTQNGTGITTGADDPPGQGGGGPALILMGQACL